ncbi:MAG: hypothetical protein IKU23_08555 [Clostridia bacterium]|nr:hypothetical protein [Clostridia bacterium]
MPTTYPNQKTVVIHREPVKSDFLGIQNENWMAALRDLRPFAFSLYLYFAANANNFTMALSPVAVRNAIGMARQTYNDQIEKLIEGGYLVPSHGNTYDFYEVPQPRAVRVVSEPSLGHSFDGECPTTGKGMTAVVQNQTAGDREINNREIGINTEAINIENPSQIYIPKVKEVVIPRPQATGRDRPQPITQPKKDIFEF